MILKGPLMLKHMLKMPTY
jgi:hypothetical protein